MAIKKISANLLANNAVHTANIASGAISAADIADNSITAAKLSTSTFAIDSLTVNTSDLVVDSSGNIGIGTSSPTDYYSDRLVVTAGNEDGITIAASATTSANYLMFADGITGNEAYRGWLGYDHNTDSFNIASHGFLRIYSGSTTQERLRIDSSGNVGIGTANTDSFKVYVDASSGKGLFVQSGDGGYTALGFDSDSGNARMSITGHDGELWMGGENSSGTGSQGEFRLKPGSSVGNLLYLDGLNAKVGIGTTSPSHLLDVAKDVGQTTPSIRVWNKNSNWGAKAGIRFLTDVSDSANYPESEIGNYRGTSSNADAGMYFSTGTSTIVERMKIDIAGRVTMPYQPAFHVYLGGGTLSSGNIIVYPNTYLNVGSHYNTSNGRFTAPVAGTYLFHWSAIGNANGDVYRYYLYRNGSSSFGGGDAQLRQDTTNSEYGDGASRVQMLTLAANDYVQVYYVADGGNASYTGGDYVNFGGYLIG